MKSGSANKYDVMNLNELKKLPINEITEVNSILFMWWVNSMPIDAIELVNSWGFKLKTMTGFT